MSDNPKRDAAYLQMRKMALDLGVTPLTREEFIKEDRRILVDWNRRRHGVDYAEEEHEATLTPTWCCGSPSPNVSRQSWYRRWWLMMKKWWKNWGGHDPDWRNW